MPQAPTPSMLLVQPSENGDAGVWDQLLTTLFLLIDAHDHSTGKGVTVKTNGITINADLTFASGGNFFALTNVKAIDFQPQAASAMTSYAGAFFVNSSDSNNLYFRTQAGSNVRITNGAALDTTTSGGIGGDYAAIPAEVAYSDASKTYTFRQTAAGNWARLQAGALRISDYNTTETTYVELAVPTAAITTYTITLPAAAPAANGTLMQYTTAGVGSFSNTGLAAISTAGVTTTSAGVTVASGQSVTVSGAGEYKHGNKILNINPLSGFGSGAVLGSAGGGTPPDLQFYIEGSAGAYWMIPLSLSIGDRIRSITWHYQRGAGTHTFALRAKTLSTGADAYVGTPASTSSGTTYTSISQSSIDKTLVSTEMLYLVWAYSITNAGNQLHSVQVTYDRP